jgi:hypothetical protein
MVADRLRLADGPGPAFDHPQGVVGVHRPVGEIPRLACGGAEEGAFLLASDAGRLDLGVQVGIGVVVGGHLVPLAALLVQAEPGPTAFR